MNGFTTIILVRPQMGENIGSAARVMLNFGLTDLRIVAPRDGWPNERATALSAKAKSVIEGAKIFATLPQALHDCELALGASARLRDMNITTHNPREALIWAKNSAKKIALVFGAENNGLNNDEVAQCHALINIPTAQYSSINLAQSVGIVVYEHFMLTQANPDMKVHNELANIACLHALNDCATAKIAGTNEAIKQKLLQLIMRTNLSPDEVNFLRGLLK